MGTTSVESALSQIQVYERHLAQAKQNYAVNRTPYNKAAIASIQGQLAHAKAELAKAKAAAKKKK